MTRLTPEVAVAVFPPPKRVAVIGYSPDPRRPSHDVATALERWGYAIFPVNPYAESTADRPVFASLAEVPGPIDIVLVFRRSENVRAHSQEILDCGPAVLWLQDGVRDDALAGEARARGIQVVQDDCIARRYAEWLLERGA